MLKGTGVKMISHLGFNCKDIQESIKFYRDIMGCSIKFTLNYNDLARAVIAEAEEEGKKAPGYAKYFQKMGDKLWSVYMEWADGCFIELFDMVGAIRKRVPGNHDLNYTHFALEVEDIHAVRDAIIARGGAKYIENEITMGADGTWTLWIHDPDGNRFELMKYTQDSLQVTGTK